MVGLALSITISGKTFSAKFLNNNMCRWLGKFSVSLFLSHFYWVQNIENILNRIGYSNIRYSKALGLVLSCVTGLVVLYTGNLIKSFTKRADF